MQATGISAVGLLGVLFVALKLIGIISWPWIWVLAPFWAGIAIIILILAILAICFGISLLKG